jgi:hypothetical protein
MGYVFLPIDCFLVSHLSPITYRPYRLHIVTCYATETPFGLLIGFINNLKVVTTINCYAVTQLTIITRQSFHSFRVFSHTESYTSDKAFNSHNKVSQTDLLYSPGLRLT